VVTASVIKKAKIHLSSLISHHSSLITHLSSLITKKMSIISELEWGKSISRREEKEVIANRLAAMVQDGDIIGVGSGSTSYLTLLSIARKIKEEGLQIKAIPTSLEITMACSQLHVPVTSLFEHTPDWTFDGADEADPAGNLIKGRGGAMFKEKLLISSSPRNYILIDSSKRVEKLGSKFPVPIEIFPIALTHVEYALKKITASPYKISLRMAEGKDGPIITENGNLIIDAWFDSITSETEQQIKQITGVIESGLFWQHNIEIIDRQ